MKMMKSAIQTISLTWLACVPLVALSQIPIGASAAAADPQPLSLEGTWVMTSAYEILADGTRTTNYGEHPNGLLMVDKNGRYSLQIFRPDRPKFVAGDKTRGTPQEYREAVLGSSTHTGRVVVDPVKSQLTFKIDSASYPNWEGVQQVRDYTFKDGVLIYSVPATASGNGTVAYSIWQHQPQ
ncbi:lipocalin-like domain-containing protein [Bradyrhizobium sp. dw_411]|uniref:lipocalin-like domain-containing protein n=1 Tax=Bradyrhizobium sp. dw_411 TaxID=2720082 RepID=UPI001BCCC823|nr:lipocalin-like domain-containing protein [Bradyrhizobium sp. dw_411]